jgi:hypothetical protein
MRWHLLVSRAQQPLILYRDTVSTGIRASKLCPQNSASSGIGNPPSLLSLMGGKISANVIWGEKSEKWGETRVKCKGKREKTANERVI